MMKHLVLVILLAVLVHGHAHDGTTTVEATGDGFVRTRGIHFLLNGNPFYATGFNAYWLIYAVSDPSQRYKVSSAFHEATSHGLTAYRQQLLEAYECCVNYKRTGKDAELIEVARADMAELLAAKYDADKLPGGKHRILYPLSQLSIIKYLKCPSRVS
ncbi:hypothetical protein PIB30_049156 [Stylosanthes scabra]|uniref:Uncharacterized protein n=1 Tax=Stylosanthes scabra TaxID=79078 RepID=A0ABU6QHF5_9FABA|nr:hypothetical protein [Stylosanthes scabra]